MPDRMALSKPQLAEIRKARQTLADLLPEIDRAKKCGVDCTEKELMREELDGLLASIEQEYGHGKR